MPEKKTEKKPEWIVEASDLRGMNESDADALKAYLARKNNPNKKR